MIGTSNLIEAIKALILLIYFFFCIEIIFCSQTNTKQIQVINTNSFRI